MRTNPIYKPEIKERKHELAMKEKVRKLFNQNGIVYDQNHYSCIDL